jgi:N-acyl-phosphatidylethanolamine-hydrolysing phospholipase D
MHFHNPWPHTRHGLADIIRWKFCLSKREQAELRYAPDSPAERVSLDPSLIAQAPVQSWRVVWLGHSSFLIQGLGKSFLIDPVFSDYCAPLPLPCLRRLVPTPCRIAELPRIDAVILTHSHYDHMDLASLRAIGKSVPLFVPSGHGMMLKKNGFLDVSEMNWWDSAEIFSGIRITAVPAQHFTARTPFDKDRAHWCGWVIAGLEKTLWHVGDSGYCPAFIEIGEHFGGIDLGMIPIGAYQPRNIMRAMHMNPSEAVRAFRDAKCNAAIAMHWGTFRLTDEPMGEPPLLLAKALYEANLPLHAFRVGAIGEIFGMDSFHGRS